MQIVNWKNHLKFPEEVKLSREAKDITSKLLCNVTERLGSNGTDEIKVLFWCVLSYVPALDLGVNCNRNLVVSFLYFLFHRSGPPVV